MGGGDRRNGCDDLPRASRSAFLEEPQRLLCLVRLGLGVRVLGRPLLTPVVAGAGPGERAARRRDA